ncbi:malate synthase G [uncultured Psychrosphaera sp.]|uniref:malate synthase G n=1 Tax=uncultured Psychrosphaera sp. TaxID=1403522 RepID=UPI00262C4283|nr:malate synthase G [uncultured Psychrosphaera sp.]
MNNIVQGREHVKSGQLSIDAELYNFVNTQVLDKIDLNKENFWKDVEKLTTELMPINEALLQTRDKLQQKINNYHKKHTNLEPKHYKQFLTEIGYLQPEPADFNITSTNVDDEIATMAGPQLVVPVMNARYAINAVNSRWGSLYDALYGTDVISSDKGAEVQSTYNPIRGQKVVEYGRDFLNKNTPLATGDFNHVTGFKIEAGQLVVQTNSGDTSLAQASQFVGYRGNVNAPTDIVLQHHKLHIIINIDANHPIGKTDLAHIKDITLESALTTIMDCEDSVAAVDAEDKCIVYRNWLGLMTGNLTETVNKNGKQFTRKLADDVEFLTPSGIATSLTGRALMFVRNVGHLMTNPAILVNGKEIPEGILDAIMTSAIGKIDLLKSATVTLTGSRSAIKNSQKGSIYIVKPKMHGADEVAFTNTLFDKVEDTLALPRHTIKMGIMDEERRTSLNLKACVEQAKHRVVFINTGFLDRTGDEIHTSMDAGVFAPKAELKAKPWIHAYEESNVAVGLNCGFKGKAQIGKGMWPIPDQMAQMMKVKIGHPKAGANTAWVPSPTAATLHVMHYHQVNVSDIQQQLLGTITSDIDTILAIPLITDECELTKELINKELENNAQGILGYVVRWVDQGVGCSKVPDINNVGLMEDRATCRISSQHVANWLHQDVCTEQQVNDVLLRMAAVVDKQNEHDPLYENMTPNVEDSLAFQAARDLIIKGVEQPSGYTEPLLHNYRLLKKQEIAKR